jgi:chromosome segregation ATPase
MNLPDFTGRVGALAKSFYTLEQKLERLEQDLRDLRGEISALAKDHTDLKMRVAILEEARNTTKAEVRAVIAETIADLRVRFAEAQAQVRANPENVLPPAPKRATDKT